MTANGANMPRCLQRGALFDLDEQIRIGSLIDSEQRNVDQLILSADKLRSLKAALMQDLLTGKRCVTALLPKPEEAST